MASSLSGVFEREKERIDDKKEGAGGWGGEERGQAEETCHTSGSQSDCLIGMPTNQEKFQSGNAKPQGLI